MGYDFTEHFSYFLGYSLSHMLYPKRFALAPKNVTEAEYIRK